MYKIYYSVLFRKIHMKRHLIILSKKLEVILKKIILVIAT